MGMAWMVVLAVAGCGGDPNGRHRVSGTVTFDRRPLPAGEIYFEPDTNRENAGPTGFASIREGRFDPASPLHVKGAVAGPQLVLINGYELPSPQLPDAGEPAGVVLFRDHSTTIILPAAASTQHFDVPKTAGDRR
ncbi:MAG: hypothetical protein ACKOWG_19225 [Planctomycetia bacterium]